MKCANTLCKRELPESHINSFFNFNDLVEIDIVLCDLCLSIISKACKLPVQDVTVRSSEEIRCQDCTTNFIPAMPALGKKSDTCSIKGERVVDKRVWFDHLKCEYYNDKPLEG